MSKEARMDFCLVLPLSLSRSLINGGFLNPFASTESTGWVGGLSKCTKETHLL